MKNIYFIILSVLVILYMIVSIRKNRLSVKESFGWIIFSIIMLILSIFPHSIDHLAPVFGVEYAPVLLLTFCVVILFIMNFVSSKKIDELQKKVVDLTQELSIVKANQNDQEKQ